MAFKQGRFTEITVSGVNISEYCDTLELSREAELMETTTFTKTSKTFLAGLQDATLTIAGKYDNTTPTGPAVLLTSLIGAPHTVPFKVYPGGNATGQQTRSFNGYITNYTESSAVGDVVKFSADVQIDGPIVASGIGV